MSEVTIRVEEREGTGKGHSRKLRQAGLIPAIVYGAGKNPVPIQVERSTFLELLRKGGGENAIFLLELGESGQKRHTMIREIDSDPVTRRVRHIDFQRVIMDQVVRVTVPIEVEGVPTGVKDHGGVLDFVTREVDVECLPGSIPKSLAIDVSKLEIGDTLELGDLEAPDGVEILEDMDRVVVSVTVPQIEEEEEEEEDVLIEAEAEEPEVIGKGGKSDEEEEGDEG